MHKYGSLIRGVRQVITRREKREMKRDFKNHADGTKGIRVAVESFNLIARNDDYNRTWPRSERYPHFRYIANKLQ